MAAPASVKDEARKLVESLPEDATWDDLHYLLYIWDLRRRGIEDSANGRRTSHEEARRHFGLPDR